MVAAVGGAYVWGEATGDAYVPGCGCNYRRCLDVGAAIGGAYVWVKL